jgi:hypothetical protein
MVKYPETVLTKDKKGNVEVRNLISRGKFVLYDYRDAKAFKQVESGKKKLYLKDESGEIKEYYIIQLKGGKALLIEPKEKEEKERKVWNDKTKKEEDMWM